MVLDMRGRICEGLLCSASCTPMRVDSVMIKKIMVRVMVYVVVRVMRLGTLCKGYHGYS